MKTIMRILLLLSLIQVAFSSGDLFGQAVGDFGSVSGGVWSNSNTWKKWTGAAFDGANGVPSSTDNVYINSGHTVTVDVGATGDCNNLTFRLITANTALTLNNSLTVNGTITYNASTAVSPGCSQIIDVGTNTLVCNGITMQNPANGSGNTNYLNINTGTVTVNGNVTNNGSNSENYVVFSGAGFLNVSGNLGISNFTASTSSVTLNGATTQNLNGLTFNNLTVSGAGNKNLTGSVTVNGTLNLGSKIVVNNFTFSLGNASTLNGSPFSSSNMFDLNGGGILVQNSNAISDLTITYPIGTNSEYSPFQITGMTATDFNGDLSIQVVNVAHPLATGNVLNRYWSTKTNSLTISSVTGSFTYTDADLLGLTETDLKVEGRLTSTGWLNSEIGTGYNFDDNKITLTGINFFTSSFSNWTLGDYTSCFPASITDIYTIASGNWNTPATWNTGAIPTSDKRIRILHNAITLNTAVTALTNIDLVIEKNGRLNLNNQNITITNTTVVNGTLYDGDSGGTNTFNGAVTVNGTYNLDRGTNIFSNTVTVNNGGILMDNQNNGTNTFSGLLTINSGGSFIPTSTSAVNFNGGIINDGTFTKAGTGTVTFTENQVLKGANTINFTANNINISAAKDVTNQGTVVLNGVLNGLDAGSKWTNDINSTLEYRFGTAPMLTGSLIATQSGNTVLYNHNADQNVRNTSYYNLKIDNLNTTTTRTKTSLGEIIVSGDLTIQATAGGICTFASAGFNLTVEGNTIINNKGIFNDGTDAGANLFKGLVTLNSGATWTSTSVISINNMIFENSITNNGTFTCGAAQFRSNSQTIAGSGVTSFAGEVRVEGNIIVSNDNSHANGLLITGNLNGNGGTGLNTFKNNDSRLLEYRGSNTPMSTGIFDVDQTGNTVYYNVNAAQTVKATIYYHLKTNQSTKTFQSGAITVNGDLTVVGGTLQTAASNTGTLLLNGTISNSGTFTMRLLENQYCDVTMSGSGDIITGSGTFSFRNLTLNGSSTKNCNASATLYFYPDINDNGTCKFENNNGAFAATVASNQLFFQRGAANLVSNATIGGTGSIELKKLRIGIHSTQDPIRATLTQDIKVVTDLFLDGTTASYLDLNGKTLTLEGDFRKTTDHTIRGGSTSSIIINGSGNLTYSIAFDQSTPGTTNNLASLIINRSAGNVTLGNELIVSNLTLLNGTITQNGNLTVSTSLALTNGGLLINGRLLTLNGGLSYTAGTITGGGNSDITIGNPSAASISLQTVTSGIRNLTLNRTAGFSLSGENSVTGTLTLTAGKITLGTYNLTLTGTAAVASASATNYIVADGTGQLKKVFATGDAAAYTLPIGDVSGNYSPTMIDFSANSVQRTIGVRVTDAQHGSDGTLTDYISRYWTFTDDQAGTYTYSASFTYVPDDLNGSAANLRVNRWDGTSWTQYNTTGALPPITVSTVNETTSPINGSVFTGRVNSIQTYTWNQTGSANWTTPANWTPNRLSPQPTDILLFNNGSTTTATNIPTQIIGRLVISGNSNVTLQSAAAATLTIGNGADPDFDIQSGSQLTMGATLSITLAASSVSAITGILTITTGTTFNTDAASVATTVTGTIVNQGTVTCTTASKLQFNTSATYNHNRDAGAIPTAAWNSGSNCSVTGVLAAVPTVATFAQAFSNFTWNCASQSGTINLNNNLTNVTGNFTITSTNSNILQLIASNNNTTLAVGGDLNIENGTFDMMGGNNTATINLSGNFNMSGGTITVSSAGNGNIVFVNTSTKSFVKTSGTISNTINFTVNTGAGLDMSTYAADGAGGTFTVQSGATLKTANVSGIDGSIPTMTTSLNTAANYTFNGSANQVTGSKLPASVNNLSIINVGTAPDNVVSMTQNVAVNGSLTLTSGIFEVGTYTLTLNGPTVAGTPSNLITTSSSNLVFGGSSTGVIIPSSVAQLNCLTINNLSGINMSNDIVLNGNLALTLTNGIITTYAYILHVVNTTATAITGYSYTSFVYGNIRRTIAANATGTTTYILPIGEISAYKPIELVNVTTGAIEPIVTALVTSLPAATTADEVTLTGMFPRNWYVQVLSGDFTSAFVRITEATSMLRKIGISPSQSGTYNLAGGNGGAATIMTSSAITNAQLPAYFAIGTGIVKTFYSYQNGNWSAGSTWTIDPSGTTFENPYSVGADYPQAGDVAHILNGRAVNATSNTSCELLSIEYGGGFDLGMYSGIFSTVTGKGLFRIKSLTFPTGDFSAFVATDGGTIEYYDVLGLLPSQATYNNLIFTLAAPADTVYTMNNFTLNGNFTINEGIFRICDNSVADSDMRLTLDIKGNVYVSNSAAITVGTRATNTSYLPLSFGWVNDNVYIPTAGTETGSLLPRYYDVYHKLYVGGDFTNYGVVKFFDPAITYPKFRSATLLSAVTVRFYGATDNSLQCYGITDFYYMVVEKGIDQSNTFTIDASLPHYFRLFGRNDLGCDGNGDSNNPDVKKALWLKAGTTRLIGNVVIPTLSEGTCNNGVNSGATNSDFFLPSKAGLVLDAPNVILLGTADSYKEVNVSYQLAAASDGIYEIGLGGCSSFSNYGKFVINDGYFSARQSGGFIFWSAASGSMEINGGKADARQLRSAGTGGGFSSFTQTGGSLNLIGRFAYTTSTIATLDDIRNVATNYSANSTGSLSSPGTFNIDQDDCAFNMSGGAINIYDICTSSKAFEINSLAINTSVTGGDVNLYTYGNTDFEVCSGAPFYNLSVYKRTAGTGKVLWTGITKSEVTARPNQPLSVVNNLTINTDGILNMNNLNTFVSGDFIIASGATYIPTSGNTTTFDGTDGQEFQINGSITDGTTDGLYNLTLSNTTATILSSTTPKTLTVNGLWTIRSLCSITDNSNTIVAKSTVYNAGSHISTATIGGVELSGTITQQIQGDGNGVFGNLNLNNSVASGTDAALFTANQTVTGILTLTQGILNIDIYRLSLHNDITTAIVNGNIAVPYSITKMIKTAGNQSDGGLLKVFSANNKFFTYPVGTSTGYSPAYISVTAANYGLISVKPVNGAQPYALEPTSTPSGHPLQKYWKVSSDIYVDVSDVTFNFTYNDTELSSGSTETLYQSQVCRNFEWYTPAPTGFVDATNNVISFNTATFDAVIDGDYTAGQADAFSDIVVFYSKKSGNWDDANPATNPWSNISNSGIDNLTTSPGPENPVVIGDGSTLNHTITISSNNKTSGSLVLNTGSVLDLGVFTGHNFGALPSQRVGEAGKLRISDNTGGTAQFPAGDFGAFIGTEGGTVEYYTIANTFIIPTTSSNVPPLNLNTYYNLNVMPSVTSAPATLSIRMPDVDLTVFNNLTSGYPTTYVGNSGFTLNANAHTHTINGNVDINGGLFYCGGFAAPQNMIVKGDITVSPSCTFIVRDVYTNTLSIYGNLINNGTVNFINGTGVCNLTFLGNEDKAFTGTNASATTILNNVTINKGTTQSSVLLMNIAGTLNTLTHNWLTLTNGTFRFAKPAGTIVLTSTTTLPKQFTIPTTACLSVDGTATITIGNFADNDADLFLNGKLEIKSGTVNVGKATMTDNNNNDIIYASAGTPEIAVSSGGILNVNGQIRYDDKTTTGSLIYNQSGGAVTIWGHNRLATRAKLTVHNSGSVFNMSDGTLTIKTGSGTTFGDLYLRPALSAVSGGTVLFDATTAGVQSYKLDANVPLFNLTIRGAASNTSTVNLSVDSLVLHGSLDIQDTYSSLIANDLDVVIGGDFTKWGTYIHGTNTTTFNGTLPQYITCNNATTFNKLTINKSSEILNLLGDFDPTVNDVFNFAQGYFDPQNRNLDTKKDVILNGTNICSGTSAGNGFIILSGGAKQYIYSNGYGSFANMKINNINDVTLANPVEITGELALQNGMFHLDDNLLTFSESAPSPTRVDGNVLSEFITTNGVSSDAGVRKYFSQGDFTFSLPIGSLSAGMSKFTPVTYTVTELYCDSPYIQVRPINSKHLATTDVADTELKYYWNVNTSPDFLAVSLTQTYNYLETDVFGTEANYFGGFLPKNSLVWQTDGVVDVHLNTITFTNTKEIAGDYTAGEKLEFEPIIVYRSIKDGYWDVNDTWQKYDIVNDKWEDCLNAGDYPQGNPAIITAGITVTARKNGCSSIDLHLLGTLKLQNFSNHNFVTLHGNGRLSMEPNSSGAFVFPGGDNSAFMDSTGSTIEYVSTSGSTISPVITTYQNLELSGAGDKTLANVDLLIKGNFTIMSDCGPFSNAGYNKNITLYGNWLNDSNNPYIPGFGTVYFSGTESQTITTTEYDIFTPKGEHFYNLVINNMIADGVTLAGDISIANDLTINSDCSLNAKSYGIGIQGNWINNSALQFVADAGIVTFNGNTSTQTYYGLTGETFNKLTIENPYGVRALCNTLINNILDLSSGSKLMVGANEVYFGTGGQITSDGVSGFIQTNGLAGDAGIVKYVQTAGAWNFNFAIGSENKYTPASYSSTTGNTGTIKVVPVNSRHPFANNNLNDELQYYWIVTSGAGFVASNLTQTYTFLMSDAPSYSASYVTACYNKLLDPNKWNPLFGGESGTTVSGTTITYTGKNYVDGEYTCGVRTNFSSILTYYSRKWATSILSAGADWRTLSTWSTVSHDDITHTPNVLPNRNPVIIASGHTVVAYDDKIILASLVLNGNLKLNTTKDHNFGSISGTGKLSLKNDIYGKFVLPIATVTSFVASNGGTYEYEGTGDLPTQNTYNNLILTGSGTSKNMPASSLLLNGNLTISGGILNNFYEKNITIKGNWTDNVSFGFNTSAGKVSFSGTSPQLINTTGDEKFYNLEIANTQGVTLNSKAEVSNNLLLTTGKINTTTNKILTLSSTNENIVIGGSSSSFVNGPLNKNIALNGSFTFPVGSGTTYGYMSLNSATAGIWQAQYNLGDRHSTNYKSPVTQVSNLEYWRAQCLSATGSAKVTLPYGTNPPSGIFSKWVLVEDSVAVPTGIWVNTLGSTIYTANSTVASKTASSFNGYSDGNYFTIAYVNLTTWLGNTADWNLATNWSGYSVPDLTDNVVIPDLSSIAPPRFNPIITSAALTNDLTIDLGASVTVSPTYSLTVNGIPTNNGSFILKSGTTGTASFIDNGVNTMTGNISIDLCLTNSQFHYIGMPLNGTNRNILDDSGTNPNFYYYDEVPSDNWADLYGSSAYLGWKPRTSMLPALDYQLGYSLYWYPSGYYPTTYRIYTLKNLDLVSGRFNTGNINFPISFTNNNQGIFDGWNLIPNPYPSAIDWDSFSKTGMGIDNSIYFWSNNRYSYYVPAGGTNLSDGIPGVAVGTASKFIPIGQSFFVKATTMSTLTIPNSSRVHNSSQGFFKQNAPSNAISNLMRVTLTREGISDEAAIRFIQPASKEYDGSWDAYKRFTTDVTLPQMYSITDSAATQLAINSLPGTAMSLDSFAIKLGYIAGMGGTFIFALSEFNFAPGTDIFLKDKQTNAYVSMNQGAQYTFTSAVGTFNNRFELIFKSASIFTEAISREWNLAGNWNKGIPVITSKVYIPAGKNPIVSTAANCRNIVVASNSSITLEGAAALIVTEDLLLKSDTLGTASLLNLSETAFTGVVKAEKYLSRNEKHLISGITQNQGMSILQHTGVQQFKEFANDWLTADTAQTFVAMKGYRTANVAYPQTLTFKGKVNQADLSTSVTRSNLGFNLLGNPYPTAINLNSFLAANSNANPTQSKLNAYVIFDEGNANNFYSENAMVSKAGFVNSTGSALIKSGQAFFVNANETGYVDFNPTMQELNTSNATVLTDNTLQRLKLSLQSDLQGIRNEALIVFTNQPIAEVEHLYHVPKTNANTNTALSLYVVSEISDYKIVAYENNNQSQTISMGISVGDSGVYTISVADFANFANQTGEIKLIDLYKDTVCNISNTLSYSFISQSGTFTNRFQIYFANTPETSQAQNDLLLDEKVSDIQDINEHTPDLVKAYTYQNHLVVSMLQSTSRKTAELEVYNQLGNKVAEYEVFNGENRFTLNVPTGIYQIKVRTSTTVYSQKIFISHD